MFMLILFYHYVINFDKKYYIIIDKEFAHRLSLNARYLEGLLSDSPLIDL
jgi:hypothetical protein